MIFFFLYDLLIEQKSKFSHVKWILWYFGISTTPMSVHEANANSFCKSQKQGNSLVRPKVTVLLKKKTQTQAAVQEQAEIKEFKMPDFKQELPDDRLYKHDDESDQSDASFWYLTVVDAQCCVCKCFTLILMSP